MSRDEFKGVSCGIISSATFGMIPLFAIPLLQEGVGMNTILFYRFAISALLIGLVLLLRKIDLRVSLRDLSKIFILGVMYSMTANFLLHSYNYMSSGIATSIHFLYPALVTIIMSLLFNEKSGFKIFMAIGLAVFGVGLLLFGDTDVKISFLGIIYALITVLTYSIFIVGVNKSSISSMNPIKFAFYNLISGTIVFLIIAATNGGIEPVPTIDSKTNLFLLALIPTMISNLTLVYSVKYVGSTVTAVLGAMEPVTALICGVIFFNEKLSPINITGVMAIIIGVSIVIFVTNHNNTQKQICAIGSK